MVDMWGVVETWHRDTHHHGQCTHDVHLTLIVAPVPPADIPDDQVPVPGARLMPGLQPQVRGVGVAAHSQQRHVRHADPADLNTNIWQGAWGPGDNVVGPGGIIVPAGYDIITVIFMRDFSTQLGFTRLQQD